MQSNRPGAARQCCSLAGGTSKLYQPTINGEIDATAFAPLDRGSSPTMGGAIQTAREYEETASVYQHRSRGYFKCQVETEVYSLATNRATRAPSIKSATPRRTCNRRVACRLRPEMRPRLPRTGGGMSAPDRGGRQSDNGASVIELDNRRPFKKFCSDCGITFTARARWHDRCSSCYAWACVAHHAGRAAAALRRLR